MNETTVAALISACASIFVGLLAFLGVVITNNRSNNKMQGEMKTAQAVTDTQIKELTREVREHNNFAVHIPAMQQQITTLEREVKELKGYHRPK